MINIPQAARFPEAAILAAKSLRQTQDQPTGLKRNQDLPGRGDGARAG